MIAVGDASITTSAIRAGPRRLDTLLTDLAARRMTAPRQPMKRIAPGALWSTELLGIRAFTSGGMDLEAVALAFFLPHGPLNFGLPRGRTWGCRKDISMPRMAVTMNSRRAPVGRFANGCQEKGNLERQKQLASTA